MGISRRRFLEVAGAAGAVAATGGLTKAVNAATSMSPATAAASPMLPRPNDSGIEHIVVVVMENRSFDHFLGWVPGANGIQEGLSYPGHKGTMHPTHHLTTFQGCGFNDPDHGYNGGRVQLDGGFMDGFHLTTNDNYAIGYYL